MTWGTVTIDGIAFRETWTVTETGSGIAIVGQESDPPLAREAVRSAHENVVGLRGRTVPITFTDKADLNGYYLVTDSGSSWFQDLGAGPVVSATWTISAMRLGNEADVEFESRIPTIGRADELAGTQTPNFWHAAPIGVTSYYTGATVPTSQATRSTVDGDITVFTGLPADVSPRWTVPVLDYLLGSVKISTDGYRRAGLTTPAEAAVGWQMDNGIVRVLPAGAGFSVEVWDGVAAAWESLKAYVPVVSGTNLAATPEFTILRNEPGECCVRLTYPGVPGRTTVDLTLRRGARFVTAVMKRHSAATLGVRRTTAEASTLQTGGIMATATDAAGNRALILSSRLLGTTDTATPYISKAAVTSFDFAVGFEVGAAPGVGNTFAELLLQYLGAAGDDTRVINR